MVLAHTISRSLAMGALPVSVALTVNTATGRFEHFKGRTRHTTHDWCVIERDNGFIRRKAWAGIKGWGGTVPRPKPISDDAGFGV